MFQTGCLSWVTKRNDVAWFVLGLLGNYVGARRPGELNHLLMLAAISI
jgi:hypothetical protein